MERFDEERLRGLAAWVRDRLEGEPESGAVRAVRRTVDHAESALSGLLRHREQYPAAGQRLLDTLGAPVWDSLVRVSLGWRDEPDFPVRWTSFSWELSAAGDMKEAMLARERLYLGELAGARSWIAALLGEMDKKTKGEA